MLAGVIGLALGEGVTKMAYRGVALSARKQSK
jgi:hypothetical protein